MIRAASFALLLMAAACAAPAFGQTPAPSAANGPAELPPNAFASGPVRADARRLAELLIPADLYLSSIRRIFLAGFDQVAKGEFADLEQQHPGLTDALRSEFAALAVADEERELNATYDRYARAIGAAFAEVDVATLHDFYDSRTGRKVIFAKFEGADYSSVLNKLAQDADAKITSADIAAVNRGAVGKMMGQLDHKDEAAFLAFSKTAAFAKLAAWTPTMAKLEVQIASEPDPEFDAEMDAVLNRVMARFGIELES